MGRFVCGRWDVVTDVGCGRDDVEHELEVLYVGYWGRWYVFYIDGR